MGRCGGAGAWTSSDGSDGDAEAAAAIV
jgi:hypothetical protein